MFERFTDRARQVVILAQEESRAMNSAYVAPGHLLLGVIREEEGLGARALHVLGIKEDEIRAVLGQGDQPVAAGRIPFTRAATHALELALREALSLGHNYIGTEHVLLGLVRDGFEITGHGCRYTLNDDKVRDEVIRQLSGPRRASKAASNGVVDVEALRVLARKADELATALSDLVGGSA